MPTYNYHCNNCHYELELTHAMPTETDRHTCPLCSAELERTPAIFSFVLKGNGWVRKIRRDNDGIPN